MTTRPTVLTALAGRAIDPVNAVAPVGAHHAIAPRRPGKPVSA